MIKYIPAIAILVSFLVSAQMCTSKQELNPVEINTSCFTQDSLKNVSWQKDQLTFFQQPKSGPLRVVVNYYNNEYFLTNENGYVSSPMSYIFDCSGNSLGKRGINYNVFTSGSKEVVTLLEGKY
ncbi:hypothetical protein [Spirosoma pollinicola]|uniref:C-type lysozyme inhibitor domain-containing protein n=1 Tax=Spirosoma pollinicola TaxID=2057025 RepID=A0A2K8Z7Y4_9BACT|nr:hypothetical protein [Spirosoma pollinicola]AUD05982.1 hypothetical protein CWM47_31540 [Spirosoma pollinicola]